MVANSLLWTKNVSDLGYANLFKFVLLSKGRSISLHE